MSFILPFSRLSSKDVAIAGGKGASLGEMTAAGIPVPPGFVILTGAFEAFLKDAGLLEALANPTSQTRQAVLSAQIPEELAAQILAAYDEAGLGKVAVRSSATAEDSANAAWAGQLETYLEVKRVDLLHSVRECWASLFSERALAYRSQQDAEAVSVAVVVQEMVEAEVAGVGFSVHPVTQEADLMMIQGAFGLGEAVVSGLVSPDTWVVDKSLGMVAQATGKKTRAWRSGEGWVELGEEGLRPSLTDEQALRYAAILRGVESHYGWPVDTEWAFRDGTFQVLQARPVTTLGPSYNRDFYDRSRPWSLKHRRPWTLFAASLFATNLGSSARRMQVAPLAVLEIEIATDMVQICLVDQDYSRWLAGVAERCVSQTADMEALLRHGLELEAEVARYKSQGHPWRGFEEVLPYLSDVVTATTQVPFGVLEALGPEPAEQARPLLALAEKLRSDSDYPWFIDHVLPPLIQRHAQKIGLARLGDPMRLATLEELASSSPPLAVWEERAERLAAGDMFVYQRIDDAETVSMHPQTGFVLARLGGARVPKAGGDEKVLHGSAAYPGVVEGIARIVSKEKDADAFQEGEILVSINANPSLMSCITAASAIVTDEGGAACHAAIVARELRKPCITGTGDATSRIAQGARIRVDAIEQTVTLLD